MAKYVTKSGRDGTLYLFRITYSESFPEYPGQTLTSNHYGYDQEHAVDRFFETYNEWNEGDNSGLQIVKVEKVRAH